MTSRIDYHSPNTYEARKERHFLAPSDEKDLKFKHKAIPILGVGLMRHLMGSCRNMVMGFEENVETRQDKGLASIGCFWHCNIMLLTANFFGYPARVLISEHSDGELIAQACLRVGVSTVRGSTTRGGGRAIIALRRALLEGHDAIITPDGPKGPAREFQQGALYLAAKTKAAIIPVGAYCDNMIEVNSWDRFRVPKPFSKVAIRWGEAIEIPQDAMERVDEWKAHVKECMEEEEVKCKRDVTRTFIGVPRGIWSKRRK